MVCLNSVIDAALFCTYPPEILGSVTNAVIFLAVPRNRYVGMISRFEEVDINVETRIEGAGAWPPNKRLIMPMEIECGRSGKRACRPRERQVKDRGAGLPQRGIPSKDRSRVYSLEFDGGRDRRIGSSC